MPTQITVNPNSLRVMLGDLKRTAGDDDTLPMLCGINLHLADRSGNTILVGSSSNRFIFGQDHIVVTGSGDPVFLPMDLVDRILAMLDAYDPYALNQMAMTLTADDTVITVAVTSTAHSSWITAERPKYGFVETFKFIKDPTPVDGPVFIDQRWLNMLCAIAERRDKPILFQAAAQHEPQHAQIGDTFRALIMPIKESDTALLPFYVPTKPATPSTEAGAA